MSEVVAEEDEIPKRRERCKKCHRVTICQPCLDEQDREQETALESLRWHSVPREQAVRFGRANADRKLGRERRLRKRLVSLDSLHEEPITESDQFWAATVEEMRNALTTVSGGLLTMMNALERSGGNVAAAARELGASEPTVRRRRKEAAAVFSRFLLAEDF